MQEILKRTEALDEAVTDAMQRLQIVMLETEMHKLQEQSQATDFWSDNLLAQSVVKRQSKLEAQITPWRQLAHAVQETRELAGLNDESLSTDLKTQLDKLETNFENLKSDLKFAGPYDSSDVIMSIHAGAGGTDAQDWAQMLFRMYVRWAESHNYAVSVVDESAGEDAGLKSITFEIGGAFIFGKLKGEHGVHRLVRLSPFNSDNLRQTSFAKVEVMPKIDQPDIVQIDDKELKIDVFRSGGHGGQSVNTTDSAVRITHLPTNIVIVIQNERSQLQNKETAMTILRSKLAQLQLEQHQENLRDLKGPNQSAEWGNQIRSYVLHPYKQVKDLRSRHESSDAEGVLEGKLDPFIDAYLEHTLGSVS